MSIVRFSELTQLARERLAAHDIKHAISLAGGIVLSRQIPLPTAPVESVTDYYITAVADTIMSKACWLNERIVVDLDLVCETARQFWMSRYHYAFPPAQIPFLSDDQRNFMNRLAGDGHRIPQPEFEFCQANSNAMILLINRLAMIMEGTNEIMAGVAPEALNIV